MREALDFNNLTRQLWLPVAVIGTRDNLELLLKPILIPMIRVFTAARMLLQRATPPKINKTHLLQRPISPSFHNQIISNLIL